MATNVELSPEAKQVSLDEFAGMTVDNMIEFFVALRDRIDAEKKQFQERMEKPYETLNKLQGKMLEILQANGSDSIKTPHGTVYKSTKKSATVGDMEQFRDFVVDNHQFELVDMRANPKAVEEYLNEHNGNLPPGVNYQQIVTVGVRRGNAKE